MTTGTKRRTLAEAAVDVLQASAKTGQEPIHHGPNGAAQPAAAVVDLGGATTQDPSGGPVGEKASAARSQATPPKGPVVASEPRHEGPEGGKKGTQEVEAEVKPTMATPSGEAPLKDGSHEAWPVKEELTAEEVEAARIARVDSIRTTMKTLSVDEDIAAMFAGSDLTEDFKKRVKTVFESAVVARAVMVVETMEKEILQASEQAVQEIREELENNVDTYLDHMVEQWMKTNEVAIESGLRTEIFEDFMGGLRTLFVENHISIPEEEVSAVEALAAQVEKLQGKLDETLNTNVELAKQVNEGKKVGIVASVSEGLTATQTEKLKTLAEGVEFTTEGEYKEKLGIIREQYFSKNQVNNMVASTNQVALNESADPVAVEQEVSGVMGSYVQAIKRTIR
jgi:SHS2 domain-containing protein